MTYERFTDRVKKVNTNENNGLQLIHEAAREGNIEKLRALLEAGAEIESRNEKGETPLHCAVSAGHTHIFYLLTGNDADLNARDHAGRTPLHVAVWKNHIGWVERLTRNYADLTIRDEEGKTPLDIAIENENAEIVKLLEQEARKFASLEQMKTLQIIHEKFSRYFTAGLIKMFQTDVKAILTSVDQLPYSEFIFGLENPTCVNLLQAEPLEGNMILDISPQVLSLLIDRLIGDGQEGTLKNRHMYRHPFTEIEHRLVSRISNLFLSELKRAWEDFIELDFSVVQIESNPQEIQLVPPDEMVVSLCFEIRLSEGRGGITLCISQGIFEQIVGKLPPDGWRERPWEEQEKMLATIHEEIQTIQTMHEGIDRKLTAELSVMLRTPIEVKLECIGEIKYGEFIFGLDDPTCCNLLRAEPLGVNMVFDISLQALKPMIDRLIGDGRQEWSPTPYQPFTETEFRLVSRITTLFLTELKSVWKNVTELDFSVVQVESNPQLIQTIPRNEVVVVFNFEVAWHENQGRGKYINFCIPYSFFEKIAAKLNTSIEGLTEYMKSQNTNELANNIGSTDCGEQEELMRLFGERVQQLEGEQL